MPMFQAMESVPFATVSRGLHHDDVVQMLERQMELARTDPVSALELLDGVTLRAAEPGLDAAEVHDWMAQQRVWLHGQLPQAGGIEAALGALEAAMNQLRQALTDDVGAAERRASAIIAAAEHRAAEMVADAERRIDESLARARRRTRKDAEKIRERARDDAERVLQRAGGRAAELLLEAEREQEAAAQAVAEAHELQHRLVNGIDAARASMRTAS